MTSLDVPADDKSASSRTITPTIITYEGKKYQFTWMQMALLAIASPFVIIILYQLLEYAAWARIIVADETTSSLNFITAMGATMQYVVNGQTFNTYSQLFQHVGAANILFSYVDDIQIYINIPGRGMIEFVTFCTGFQAIIIFFALIIFTPHPLDKATRKGMWMRKLTALFWSTLIFYVVNIIRMWIQLGLYYIGFAWEDVHYSISAAVSFIAIIIVILMHRFMPEFVISIVWSGIDIKKRYFPNFGYKKPKTNVGTKDS
ncbi:MAG TPA: archaeosortase H [Candidatus Lokiarchaeia archaeon]|nr:archaeosortase H [Candidatus Lokiarchaeia archaeon]